MSPNDRAGVIAEYVRALRDLPAWSVNQAYDNWQRQHARKPSPAEIRMLAERAIKPITDELNERALRERASIAPPERKRCSPEAAARIIREAGYDKPEGPQTEEPYEWRGQPSDAALSKARADNRMIQMTLAHNAQAIVRKAEPQAPQGGQKEEEQ